MFAASFFFVTVFYQEKCPINRTDYRRSKNLNVSHVASKPKMCYDWGKMRREILWKNKICKKDSSGIQTVGSVLEGHRKLDLPAAEGPDGHPR